MADRQPSDPARRGTRPASTPDSYATPTDPRELTPDVQLPVDRWLGEKPIVGDRR